MVSSYVIITGIFGIVAAAAGLMWVYGVEFHPMQITAVVVIVLIGLGGAAAVKILKLDRPNRNPGKTGEEMKKAKEFAIDYWKETYGEDLDDKEFHSIRRSFSNGSKAWGFVLNRGLNSKKPGAPIVVCVGKDAKSGGGLEILRENDHPGPEELENPLVFASAGFTGAPFPGMTPESDASFHRSRYGQDKGPTFNIGPSPGSGWDDFVARRKQDNQ